MSIGEEHSFIRKSVNVWRMDPALVAAQATDPVAHVVNGKEEDIWLWRCINEANIRYKQSEKGKCHAQLIEPFHFLENLLNLSTDCCV